jgi:hypothetical protein
MKWAPNPNQVMPALMGFTWSEENEFYRKEVWNFIVKTHSRVVTAINSRMEQGSGLGHYKVRRAPKKIYVQFLPVKFADSSYKREDESTAYVTIGVKDKADSKARGDKLALLIAEVYLEPTQKNEAHVKYWKEMAKEVSKRK